MIVLDTHALLWFDSAPGRIGKQAAEAIADDGELAISTASALEIAYLLNRGRLELDRPLARWFSDALKLNRVEAIAPDMPIALRAGSLDADRFPRDPLDRLIYATAVERGGRLVSADGALRAADPERVIW